METSKEESNKIENNSTVLNEIKNKNESINLADIKNDESMSTSFSESLNLSPNLSSKNNKNQEQIDMAIESIRKNLKNLEQSQQIIVKNLFNEKTITNSSMSIKIEFSDDNKSNDYLIMETNFLTKTIFPNLSAKSEDGN